MCTSPATSPSPDRTDGDDDTVSGEVDTTGSGSPDEPDPDEYEPL